MVSPEQVRKWQTELGEHESRARSLRRWIDAAKILLEGNAETKAFEELAEFLEPAEDSRPKNFMGTINRIVNESAAPITKRTLKEMLRKEGFPESQVDGTYFYVALRKLAGVDRITVLKNGHLTKGTRE
jgi:hypothetical protein